MPGWELYGDEEQAALNDLFYLQNGIMFAHGFDKQRNGHYKVREFEDLFATRMGVQHAQAVSSGSAAVKIALQAAGVMPGDEVITSAFTFVATVEAILEVGARPVLVDVDLTLNMDEAGIRAAYSAKTGAIVAVHMMGECCALPYEELIGGARPVPFVEDACQALGASYSGKQAGTLGTLGAYSFDGGKTLCTGEGGMVVTNDQQQYYTSRAKHDHGHAYQPEMPRGRDFGRTRGFNHRMTEMQAAVGIAQLGKLDLILTKQRKHKRALLKAILNPAVDPRKDDPVWFPPDMVLNRWLLRQGADPKGDACDSLVFFCDTRAQADKFVDGMAKYGLSTKNLPDALDWHFAGRWPLYMRDQCRHDGSGWTKTARLLERAIALPIMVNWSADDIAAMAENLKSIASEVK